MVLILPYPPSVNHYWRHVGPRTLISRQGRRYRKDVCDLLSGNRQPPLTSKLAVEIDVLPPDRRRRDIDNILKAILDSLSHAGVYEDDFLIDQLIVRRHEVYPGGQIVVRIKELHEDSLKNNNENTSFETT